MNEAPADAWATSLPVYLIGDNIIIIITVTIIIIIIISSSSTITMCVRILVGLWHLCTNNDVLTRL